MFVVSLLACKYGFTTFIFLSYRTRYFLEHLNICANLLIIDLSELQLIHNPHSWKRLSILGAILGMCLMVHRHSCCILYSTLRTLVFFHHNNNVMATHTHLITIMSLSKKIVYCMRPDLVYHFFQNVPVTKFLYHKYRQIEKDLIQNS